MVAASDSELIWENPKPLGSLSERRKRWHVAVEESDGEEDSWRRIFDWSCGWRRNGIGLRL